MSKNSTSAHSAHCEVNGCICNAWKVVCGCGKAVSHEDVARLRRENQKLRGKTSKLEMHLRQAEHDVTVECAEARPYRDLVKAIVAALHQLDCETPR
jgi:hypothetical protein